MSTPLHPLRPGVLSQIAAERRWQDQRWGGRPGVDRINEHTYAAVLGEEFGEVCKAWLERDIRHLRHELIQVAAVALAWIEEIDNDGRDRWNSGASAARTKHAELELEDATPAGETGS
jgi:NTP pyrophosphatase (non-canonical NTP hydrolase)